MKKIIRLTENDLHQIIKESVQNIISEVLNDPVAHEDAYALAGAAKGATKTLGGKIKGMFNPAWKARKERQYNTFADRGEELRNRLQTINKGNPNYNDSEEVDNDIAARNNGYNNPRRAAKQYGF